MKITTKDKDLIVSGITDFDLAQTMECGQCFHFVCVGDNEYGIVNGKYFLHAKQEKDVLTLFDTSEEEFYNVWVPYFDLNTDYAKIKRTLLKSDGLLKDSIEDMWGVRILNQDFFETLISFIISQNKQIPHIKQLVSLISEKYGNFAGEINGERFYTFPDAAAMSEITLEELYECKTGFRAPYIYDAVSKVNMGLIDGAGLRKLTEEECRSELTKIKGVGDKVANCTMLFSLGFRAAFPIDVWIKRIMEYMYFEGDTKKEVISEFAREHFGDLGGYAQQYLFYYGRVNGIGKKK